MSNGKKNEFIIKEVNGRMYEVRFTTFHPKTLEESALVLRLDDGSPESGMKIENGFENGISAEALVPVVKSIADIGDLENLYSEKFIVDRLVQGLAINAQAKAKMILQSLARPSTNGKMTTAQRDVFMDMITPEWWREQAQRHQGQCSQALNAEIKRLYDSKD